MGDSSYNGFIKRLRGSAPSVHAVAEHLRITNGWAVRINPTPIAPPGSEMWRYADSGDLELSVPISVKQTSRDFTGAADWPFPNFMIDSCDTWDRMVHKPMYIYTVNPKLTHAGRVSIKTIDRWERVEVDDVNYGRELKIVAPLDCVEWMELRA